MAKTLEDVKRIHEMGNHLTELGIPERITNRIHRWANIEKKRIRKGGNQ